MLDKSAEVLISVRSGGKYSDFQTFTYVHDKGKATFLFWQHRSRDLRILQSQAQVRTGPIVTASDKRFEIPIEREK
jgi:hypothetical protein